MRIYYWQPSYYENFGDYLNVPLLQALGHEPEVPMAGEPCLFAIGSILHSSHYRHCPGRPLTVWGSGLGNMDRPPVGTRFLAVRGPLTRELLELPDSVPLGDPALLLPQLINPLPKPLASGEVLYINHCSAPFPFCMEGCDAGLATLLQSEKIMPLVARIAAASFVASESLHGCIVAAAYGVPWAFASYRWRQDFSGPTKITDWMQYLGLPPLRFAAATLSEAKFWWQKVGRHGKLQDTRPLLDGFASIDF